MGWTAVADDLTGAQDLASVLGSPAQPAWVAQGVSALRGLPGPRIVDAGTRFLAPGRAGLLVRRAWAQLGAGGYRYQKIDSTLRGNPREEIEAFLSASAAPWVTVLPAYPALGRVTRQGRLWVHGQRLDRSEYARDPLSPARADGPQALLQGLPSAHAGTALLRRGSGALRAWIRAQRSQGKRLFSFDCRDGRDLALIASSTLAQGCRHFAGASGLAQALVRAQGRPSSLVPVPRLPWLILAGSVSQRSFEQLGELLQGGTPWGWMRSIRPKSRLSAKALPELLKVLRWYRALAISSLSRREDLGPWLRQQGAQSPLARQRLAERSLDAMAGLGAWMLQRMPVACLLTGGHSLERFYRRLGVERSAVLGQALPGLALGRAFRADGTWAWVASKPGGFGDAGLLQRFLQRAGLPRQPQGPRFKAWERAL